MSKRIYADFSYLILLAATFGAVMVLGIFVAPVVFNSDKITVGLCIDHYNAGMVMAEIFRRFGHWLNMLVIFVLIYEAAWYKAGQRDALSFASAFIVVFTSLLFSEVYTPKILDMQALGAEATKSDTFANIHLASELDFKILAVALLVLFVRRLMLLRRT
ncbi:MAG: DUF4149 domain-containing protein [Epsilonproteobacteria bacterium]|nr:DUF4149 domain-containing protein [Campylobacterota bacterium]